MLMIQQVRNYNIIAAVVGVYITQLSCWYQGGWIPAIFVNSDLNHVNVAAEIKTKYSSQSHCYVPGFGCPESKYSVLGWK